MRQLDLFAALQPRTEGIDTEFKSALGGMPSSFWESYSAMANTQGGTIVLGVARKPTGWGAQHWRSPHLAPDSSHTALSSPHWMPALLSLAEPARLKPRLPAAKMQALVLRFPDVPNRPDQAYRTVSQFLSKLSL